MEWRKYQDRAADLCVSSFALGERATLLQMPTGGGKTKVAADIVLRMQKLGHLPCLWITHTDEIHQQTTDKLRELFGRENVGVLTTNTNTRNMYLFANPDVTVAGQQVTWSRAIRAGHKLPNYKLIVVDEAHHARARTWTELIDHWPDAHVLGLTATPARGDGKGLGNKFGRMIQGQDYGGTYRELIDGGFLVDTPLDHIYTWPVDMKGIKKRAGDYEKEAASERLDTPERVGDCVAHWLKLAGGRQTVCYASSVSHAHHLTERFKAAGVKAATIDANTDIDDRRKTITALREGRLSVVTNYGVLTEGADIQSVSCIILERATLQRQLYLQMVGRGLRTWVDKTECMLIDCVGLALEHGIPTDPITWSLDVDKRADKPTVNGSAPSLKPCPACNRAVRRPPCVCGWMPKPVKIAKYGEPIAEGELQRLSDRKVGRVKTILANPRRKVYEQYKAIARAKRMKLGWVAYAFKKKYGEFPPIDFELPNPARCKPATYLTAAQKLAQRRKFKPGWAAMKFKDTFGFHPNSDAMRARTQ